MTVDAPGLPQELPTLQGGLVTLREFLDTDVELVRAAAWDPLIPLITTVPAAPTDDVALLACLRRQRSRLTDGIGYSFAIAEASTGTAVGQIGLWLRDLDFGRASVGYWVAPSARRRGFARAALTALSDWAVALPPVDRVELYVEPWNEGSWRAAEATGFQREGLLRSWQRVGDTRRDMFMYSRLAPSTTGLPADRGDSV